MMLPWPVATVALFVVLGAYYLLPRAWQPAWLLAASYAFCAMWSLHAAATLALVTALNFAGGWLLGRRPQAALLAALLIADVGILFGLKLWASSLEMVSQLLTTPDGVATWEAGRAFLPIGVSFYTLGGMSYLVDVHRKEARPARSLVHFALYMAWFPKLIAGPIERAREFLPQLEAERRLDHEALAVNGGLILLGLLRKVVFAGLLITVVWRLSPFTGTPDRIVLWLIALALYVYNDFAGYSLIARGVSGLFCIRLSRNFRAPFLARSVGDFWARWHITLSTWLRDYVFYPFTRLLLRRFQSWPRGSHVALGSIVTLLASGLWHGVRWRFVVWGLAAGIAVALSPARSASAGARRRLLEPVATWLTLLVLLIPFALPWPAMRALADVIADPIGWFQLSRRVLVELILLALVSLALDYASEREPAEVPALSAARPVRIAAVALAMLAILFASINAQARPVLYQFF